MLAVQQSVSWPKIWSTEPETDLQTRLSRLPFYAPTAGFGDANFSGIVEDVSALLAKGPAFLSQAAALIGKAGPYLSTIQNVVEDPALPQFVERVKTLRAIEEAKVAKRPVVPGKPVPKAIGVGLKSFLKPLDAAIYIEKYPWTPWIAGIGAVLVIGGLGFGIGYLTVRRRATSVTAGYSWRR